MTQEEFLSGLREFIVLVAEKKPEANYIAYTAVNLATDQSLKAPANISPSVLGNINNAWNYGDAICSIISAADLLLQNGLDEVNDKESIENYTKASILLISATISIAMTAAGMGAWSFAIATMCDFGIASWDFYRSARKYWDFEYWLEEQLYELDYLTRKINEPDVGDKLHQYEARKEHIIENIKAYATCHYHQKLINSDAEDKSKEALGFQENFNMIFKSHKLTNIGDEDKNEILNHVSAKYIQTPRNSDMLRAEQVKENLKKDTQDKGIKLALKTASMVGMILIAVGASCHPVGLAITAGVAAGYLLYSFGLPAAKKLWNHYCNSSTQKNDNTNNQEISIKENQNQSLDETTTTSMDTSKKQTINKTNINAFITSLETNGYIADVIEEIINDSDDQLSMMKKINERKLELFTFYVNRVHKDPEKDIDKEEFKLFIDQGLSYKSNYRCSQPKVIYANHNKSYYCNQPYEVNIN
ncbi:hypothetical protein L3V82_03635 [Thiotrichales bacterium 19S3-7]|nr:hypothetical protein [Thiotrichales bacterium 19S3-7]MCF6801261.1 hypothetical protein [Thiotrichales bacterium 19S3-11]